MNEWFYLGKYQIHLAGSRRTALLMLLWYLLS
jgi:hypothetical protein